MKTMQTRFFEAYNGRRIDHVDEDELKLNVCETLSIIYYLCGLSIPETKTFMGLVEYFVQRLFDVFPYYYQGEVEIAMQLGAEGRLGDYRGITIQTLMNWMWRFKESPERQEAKAAVRKEEEDQQKMLRNPRMSDMEERYMLEEVYNRYVTYSYVTSDLVPSIYAALQRRNILVNSQEEKLKALEEAQKSDIAIASVLAQKTLLLKFFDTLRDNGTPLKLLTPEERINFFP